MIFNFLLRGFSAAIKLIFLLYIAKVNGNEFVGKYSLIMSIAAISSIFLGFEIHSGFGRVVHKVNESLQKEYIGSQLKFYIFLYLFSIPVITFVSIYYLKLELLTGIILSYAICIDHFSSELFRILITKIKTREATYFHILRNVPYLLILFFLDYYNIIKISINSYIYFWFIANFIAITLLFSKHFPNNTFPKFKEIFSYKLAKVIELAKDSRFYFLLALLGTITSNIDKFILSETIGLEQLGVYFALISIGSVINIFLSYTIGIHQGPKIVRDYALCGFECYKKKRLLLFKDYSLYTRSSSAILVFGFIISNYLKLTHYDGKLDLLVLILFSISLNSLNEVFKLDIYIAKLDKSLFLINLILLFISLINLVLFSKFFGIHGACIAVCINSVIQLILYNIFSKKALSKLESII